MPESETYQTIQNNIRESIKSRKEQKEFFKEQIIILDNRKTPLDSAIKSIDGVVFDQVEEVNDTLRNKKTAYEARIAAGCRSNLFWRRTGLSTSMYGMLVNTTYTYTCTKTSPVGYSSVGISTTSITYISGTNGSTTTVNGLKSLIGITSENLYGIRYYHEPYSTDILDSFITKFIGTIGTASTIVTAFSPYEDNTGSLNIVTPRQLLVCSKPGVFSIENNEIVGIGTTVADLSIINSGLSSESIVYTFSVETAALSSVTAPESDGSFVEFTVLQSANDAQGLAVNFGKNPYSPQTIGIMTSRSEVGIGVSVNFVNDGNPSSAQSWKPELLNSGRNAGIEPQVGGGVIYYDVGFTVKPQKLVDGNWVDASEGDIAYTYTLNGVDTARVVNCGTCTAEEDALTNAISIASSSTSQFSSGISTVNARLSISSALRKERNKINIQIWGSRQLLGKLNDEDAEDEVLQTVLTDPTIAGIIT